MYGIVNKSMEDLVRTRFGQLTWEKVRQKSGLQEDFFLSHEAYDDAITYRLAGAIAEEIQLPVDQVLELFGEWWILKTGKEKYAGLMEAGGQNLQEFLENLPFFHNRVMLIYPKLTPPEFRVSDKTASSICVHYYSKREGLQAFVRGLLSGLANMYQVKVTIELVDSREQGSDHEIFKVSW